MRRSAGPPCAPRPSARPSPDRGAAGGLRCADRSGSWHDLQAAARRQAATDPEWQADYRRWRPPVERAVAWLVQHGNRRLRYRGTINNNTWLHTRAAALNLRRPTNLGLTHTRGSWQLAPATT
ncbi:transposase [Streptomyces sp. NPDC057579]|uniref:transposase n=1 Tax=Streptomyces sp. NPDC057579 TaxID=3346172 RepID=UPI003693D498